MKEPRKTAVAAPRNKRWLCVLGAGVVLNLVLIRYVNRQPIAAVLAIWLGGATLSYFLIPSGNRKTSRIVVSLTEGLLVGLLGGWVTSICGILLLAKVLVWSMRAT
jgi:hypothetical protein